MNNKTTNNNVTIINMPKFYYVIIAVLLLVLIAVLIIWIISDNPNNIDNAPEDTSIPSSITATEKPTQMPTVEVYENKILSPADNEMIPLNSYLKIEWTTPAREGCSLVIKNRETGQITELEVTAYDTFYSDLVEDMFEKDTSYDIEFRYYDNQGRMMILDTVSVFVEGHNDNIINDYAKHELNVSIIWPYIIEVAREDLSYNTTYTDSNGKETNENVIGAGISPALVQLFSLEEELLIETYTSASGHVVIPNIEVGEYFISVKAEGFDNLYQYIRLDGDTLILDEYWYQEFVMYKTGVDAYQYYRINFTLNNSSIPNMDLYLEYGEFGNHKYNIYTDENGEFGCYYMLSPGEYSIYKIINMNYDEYVMSFLIPDDISDNEISIELNEN